MTVAARLHSVQPISWPLVALGDVATTQYGLSEPPTPGGNTPIVGMEHIRDGRVVLANLPTVSLSDAKRERCALREGDLLFNRTNSAALVGKCGIVPALDEHVIVFASYLIRIAADRLKVDPEFLNYVLNSSTGVEKIRRLATPGVSQYNVNPTALKSRFRFLLPPLSDQRAIVAAVRSIDRAVALVDALLTTTRRFKRGLMQRLLAPATSASASPAGWQRHKLGELLSQRVETDRPDLPLLAVTAGRGVIPRDHLDRRDSSNPDKSLYLRVVPGDIVYNTMRMWQGVSARSCLEGIVSPAYTVCVPGPAVDSEFAAVLFKHKPIVHLFHRHSQGLVKDTLNLKFDRLARIRVRVPDIGTQRSIAALFRGIDTELALLEQLAAALDRQKRALLDKLLSGELRLPPI